MIGIPQVGTLESATISGVSHGSLSITGRYSRLAIIDDTGKISTAGLQVAEGCGNATLAIYRNFLIGKSYLRAHQSPPGGAIPIA